MSGPGPGKERTHVVTGAFGFSGRYITRRLLEKSYAVRTLTNSPNRSNPFGGRLSVYPYDFERPEKLAESLSGASVLYNTYWVRFNSRAFSFRAAVSNTCRLFEAAKAAGIERIVHVSILNPDINSPFEYYRGKAQLEEALVKSGIPHSILRPGVLFGREGILINNIAWFLRKFPLFPIPGNGKYRLQPIHIDDLAGLAVQQAEEVGNKIIDAVGPETFTYMELVKKIALIIGRKPLILPLPPLAAYVASWLLGKILGDVVTTLDELRGLMSDILYADSPPAGVTGLTAWMEENSASLGQRYLSELRRRTNRTLEYDRL